MQTSPFRWATVVAMVVVLVAAAPGHAQTSPAREPELVRFGSVGGLTDGGLYLAEALGYFAEGGIKLERHRMGGGSALTTGLATKSLDVAGIAVSAGLFNAVHQKIGLRIVGDKQSIRPGMAAAQFVVRAELVGNDSRETFNNLKGKTLAVSSKGTSAWWTVVMLLEKHGVSVKDLGKVVEMSYGDVGTAFLQNAVQGAIVLEPFLSRVARYKEVKVVSDLTEVLPGGAASLVAMVYGEDFATKRRPTAQRFMEAYMKGVRVYMDAFVKGKDKDKVIGIIAKAANVDVELVKTSVPTGLDPNQAVDVQLLEEVQKFFIREGNLKEPVDLNKLIDRSFAEEAVRKLGKYPG